MTEHAPNNPWQFRFIIPFKLQSVNVACIGCVEKFFHKSPHPQPGSDLDLSISGGAASMSWMGKSDFEDDEE